MVRQEERPWRGQTSVFLDLRTASHRAQRGPDAPRDPRLASSLEWAVSAAASIGAHTLRAGRDLDLIADPNLSERQRFAHSDQLAAYLATVREASRPDLNTVAGALRTAARDSTLVAVLGRLDPDTLAVLTHSRPRGRTTPALALVLDVDTWAEAWLPDAEPPLAPALPPDSEPPAPSACEAAVGILRASGWRVAIVRRETTIASAWQVLLAGYGASRESMRVR
jgi:hypothetical protein